MGTLVRHGEGQGAVWTYTPLGTPQAYGKLDTASLLLLAVQASRLVCRAPSSGVRAAWRLVLDVARGRRPLLSTDEISAAADRLLGSKPKDDEDGCSFSVTLVDGAGGIAAAISPNDIDDVIQSVLYLTWDFYRRYADAPLGDQLSSAVTDLLGKVAFLLRDDAAALKRLHDLEARCLIHGWTHTHEVVPDDVLRHVLASSSRADAEARARAWRLGPEPPALPKWTPPPPTAEELARREAARLAAEVEQQRWEAMSPEERAKAERAVVRTSLNGLIKRGVF